MRVRYFVAKKNIVAKNIVAKVWSLALIAALSFQGIGLENSYRAVQAQPIPPPEPSPLEPRRDPWLPSVPRTLSPLERRRLEEGVKFLAQLGQANFDAGNIRVAFDLWYRELRLRRVLGDLNEEVMALARVGAIAWQETLRDDVTVITERLDTILATVRFDAVPNPSLLNALGNAYRQIRDIPRSLALYQRAANDARRVGDRTALKESLAVVGELQLTRFDYPQAALAYEELIAIARLEGDRYHEGLYLTELAEVYQQAEEAENGVRVRQDLEREYLRYPQTPELIRLYVDNKLAIAADYEALNQPEAASQAYQTAFALAWGQEWLSVAGEALEKLAMLFDTYEQPAYALRVYRELLKVQQQSYDIYGLMTTHERIGKIHLEQEQYNQARSAFQQALEYALVLNYRPNYFRNQIENSRPRRTLPPGNVPEEDAPAPEPPSQPSLAPAAPTESSTETPDPLPSETPAVPTPVTPETPSAPVNPTVPLEESPVLIPEELLPQYPSSPEELEEQLQRYEEELRSPEGDLDVPQDSPEEVSDPQPTLEELGQ